MNIVRLVRRLFHPAIICELAEDIEDQVICLQAHSDYYAWEGLWRGEKVSVDYHVLIGNAKFSGLNRNMIFCILYKLEKKKDRKRKQEDQITNRHMIAKNQFLLSFQPQIQQQNLGLSSLEKLLIREIKHLRQEIAIARREMMQIAQPQENSRVPTLESRIATFNRQLMEVRKLHRQARELFEVTELPLKKEPAIDCQKIRTDSLIELVDEELRATRKTLESLQSA